MRRLAVLAAVGVLALSGGASANPTVPTVRKPMAIYVTGWYLRHSGSWVFRDSGSIDCDGGRLNRTHWRCRVWWRNGGRCFAGRVQAYGVYFRRGPYYNAHGRFRGRYC